MTERDLDVVVLDVDSWPRPDAAWSSSCTAFPGGVVFTQDGHLEATVELLGDPRSGVTRWEWSLPSSSGSGRTSSWRSSSVAAGDPRPEKETPRSEDPGDAFVESAEFPPKPIRTARRRS